jgi:predicted GH43/DUF377 family glycosyl hydrolase
MHDLRHHGLVHYALKRGGSIHPITLPKELTGETGIMNPSIFMHEGRILLNVRHVNYTLYHSEGKKWPHTWGPLQYIHPENDISLTTYNIMTELNGDLEVIHSSRIDTSELDTKPTWNFIGLEDGRLFNWEGRLFLCGVRRDCYDDKGKGRMELQEIEYINDRWKEVARYPIPAPGDDNTYCEKNWMPIIDMPWHFVKWCNPCEVVKFDIKTKTTTTVHLTSESNVVSRTEIPRDLRGGTQVYPIGEGRRMTLTHEVDLNKDTFGRKDGHYNHRVLIWDKDWNLEKWTSDFNFLGSQIDPTTGNEYNIEFATGMIFHEGNIIIAFGYQDNGTFLLKIPKDVFFDFVNRC